MRSEWIETTLGELAPFAYGKGLPEHKRDHTGNVPVYGSNGIVGFHNESLTSSPTIIIGRKGTVGAIHFSQKVCWPIDTTFYIADEDIEILRFKYYLLKTLGLEHMNADSAVPGLSRDAAHARKIRIPPLPEQRAIAHILGTLDDKIELNRRMNVTLEEMARALFKSWFVDFDPVRAKAAVRREHPDWSNAQVSRAACPTLKPEITELFPDEFENSELGEIPKGWTVGKFGDCCTVKGGYAYKSKDFTEEGFPLLRIKNINSNYTIDLFDVVYIPEEIAMKTKDFWLDDGDLVMAMTGATIGKFGLIANRDNTPNALLNQRVAKLLPQIKSLRKPWFQFISLLVTDVYEQIVNIGGGSAQPNISSSQIESCQFIVPDDNSIIKFTDIIDPFMRKWLLNLKEKQTLASLRDTLLPKLISGELRVKDAERIVERTL